MKILWLFKYRPHWNFNRWFHMGFAEAIAKQPRIELKSYGLNMTNGYPKYDLQLYKKAESIESLRRKFKFDIIIMDGKDRVTNNKGTINLLPPGTAKFKDCPKIVIEGDFHNYKEKTQWYTENGVDLILHRHSNNVNLGENKLPNIKHIWFPCSVDTDQMKPNNNINRKNKLCFVGGLNCCYVYRIKAVQKLKEVGMIEVNRRVKGQQYIECLQSYVGHINGSSLFNIETAKMFEIMACGSVLLTDESEDYGLKKLFVKDSYVTYKRNCSDIVFKAQKIIQNADYRKYITDRAVKCINEFHTHEIRIEQLFKIIKENYGIC